MPEKNSRREDVVLDLEWLQGIRDLPTPKLRKRRNECRELESEFSYARRLLQGKIDILANELKRRSEGGQSDVEDLVRRLPSILAGDGAPGAKSLGSGRPAGSKRFLDQELPANAGKYRRRTERLATKLAQVATATDEDLADLLEELAEEERTVSDNRRKAQQVVDTVNAELVRRYRDGEEDPSALLAQ